MIFLNFKTSLVIAPLPARVIMTHCVRKSICDSHLRFDTNNKRNFLNIGGRSNFFKKNF